MKNWKTYLIMLGIIIFFIWFISIINKQSKIVFNDVKLDDSTNIIVNQTSSSYYDTILFLGLTKLGISGVFVDIRNLSKNSVADSENKGMDLSAHIRELNGNYYIFTGELGRHESINVLSHELIHLQQYHTGRLKYGNDTVTWDGEKFGKDEIPYKFRPWEIDAEESGNKLSKELTKTLLNKNQIND